MIHYFLAYSSRKCILDWLLIILQRNFLSMFYQKEHPQSLLEKWRKWQRKSGHLIFGLCPTTKDDGTICTHDKAIVDRQLKAWNLWREYLSASNKQNKKTVAFQNFLNLLGEQFFQCSWLVATFKREERKTHQTPTQPYTLTIARLICTLRINLKGTL